MRWLLLLGELEVEMKVRVRREGIMASVGMVPPGRQLRGNASFDPRCNFSRTSHRRRICSETGHFAAVYALTEHWGPSGSRMFVSHLILQPHLSLRPTSRVVLDCLARFSPLISHRMGGRRLSRQMGN